MRRAFGKVGCLRSAWYLASAAIAMIRARPTTTSARFDRIFRRQLDPWDFAGLGGQPRYQQALAMIEAVHGKSCHRALELGCAEGIFTELLADRCESLIAVDVSGIALERAVSRRQWPNHVHFQQLDLQREALPGAFDLIVAMEVLVYVLRPWVLRAACAKLIDALVPGGYLFVEHGRENDVPGDPRWAKRLLRGVTNIDALFAAHPSLAVVSTLRTGTDIYSLFRKLE